MNAVSLVVRTREECEDKLKYYQSYCKKKVRKIAIIKKIEHLPHHHEIITLKKRAAAWASRTGECRQQATYPHEINNIHSKPRQPPEKALIVRKMLRW